jgi:hypothetical protein
MVMSKPTSLEQEEAHYLPELPPGPDDDPYILDSLPPEFTAKPFTIED